MFIIYDNEIIDTILLMDIKLRKGKTLTKYLLRFKVDE